MTGGRTSQSSYDPTKIRVLVVDDMPAVRLMVSTHLEALGFTQVVEAEDGEQAWNIICMGVADPSFAIGLVIADWRMKAMSGADLLRSIRTFDKTRALPVIMVTAESSQTHLAQAFSLGVNEYLVKPFASDALNQKIDIVFRALASS